MDNASGLEVGRIFSLGSMAILRSLGLFSKNFVILLMLLSILAGLWGSVKSEVHTETGD